MIAQLQLTWNENSSYCLEVGHLVVTVNGISDVQGMLEQFRNSRSVEMVIFSKLFIEHRHVLRCSLGLQRRSKFVENPFETPNGECQPCTACSIALRRWRPMEVKRNCHADIAFTKPV